jgi:hypothetical protein
MADDDKISSEKLALGMKEVRDQMTAAAEARHRSNSELFKTVGQLSLAQIRIEDNQQRQDMRLGDVEETLKRIESRTEADAEVNAKTLKKTNSTFLEQRLGLAVVGIITWVIQYLTSGHH